MKFPNIFRILKFLILFLLFRTPFSLIVLPFKTISNNNESNSSFNIHNYIYSNILIGDLNQSMDVFYSSNDHSYFLDEESCKGENYYFNNYSSYNITPQNYIDIEGDEDEDSKAIKINETIYLYTNLNLSKIIEIKNFPLLIRKSQIITPKLCLLIGLLFRTQGTLKIINFIEQLKHFNLIDNLAWTMKYISENEGLLIIGSEPHIYDPLNYNESHLRTSKPRIIEYSNNWNINVNKIFSGNNLISINIFCIISQENKYIMGNKEYNNSIVNEFFGEYLNKNICFYHHDSFNQNYYYCNKNLFSKKDINKFPELCLLIIDLEENFVFSGEELFYEEKDFYYFKIYFNDFSQGSWLIGKMFLKKYQLIFNHDKKIIGYYKIKDDESNEEEKKKTSLSKTKNVNNMIFILVILLIILLIIIGILLTKLYFSQLCSNKHRKKLVNELEDEDYSSSNEKGKDNNDMLLDMNF